MRQLRANSLIQLVLIIGLIVAVTCNSQSDSSIVKQLDRKARAIFNEKSSLVTSNSAIK